MSLRLSLALVVAQIVPDDSVKGRKSVPYEACTQAGISHQSETNRVSGAARRTNARTARQGTPAYTAS